MDETGQFHPTNHFMRQLFAIIFLFQLSCSGSAEWSVNKKQEEQAARITIIRDSWGIPHVYGKTDADAVFGLMYAQCEENFEKVERAYIEKLGRRAEIDGDTYLYNDLLSQLLYDTVSAKEAYKQSSPELKKILQAFSDGIHYFLAKNPGTKPLLLHRFEPWYPFLFTDGAYVSLKTETLSIDDIRRMYKLPSTFYSETGEPRGSNGFAIAPSKTANNKALLYINPHVSFDFRMEAHMISEEGLNAYGAVTWGQFFIYQGFNEACGWMHTSSMADGTDLYADYLVEKDKLFYTRYDDSLKPVLQKQLFFRFKKNGLVKEYSSPAYVTHHGPVVGKSEDGKLLSLKTFHDPLLSLQQSWYRTKAKSLKEFTKVMELCTNVSTNTVYADKEGNIAYWHGNFMPKRNAQYNWSQPLDGSTAKTAWQGAHTLNEIVHVINPPQGFIQNCNSSPFHVSGMHSLDQNVFPAYMAPDGENFRSLLAIRELEKETNYTIDKMIALGFNRYLSAFDSLLPPLFRAYQNLSTTDALRKETSEQIALLRNWNRESNITSSATTLAILWAYNLLQKASPELAGENSNSQSDWMTAIAKNTPSQNLLVTLEETSQQLRSLFGSWQVPWGNINRYQRNADGNFDDNKESLPVGFASAIFGSLPSFEPVWYKTSKGYGTAGNSFVAAVEFGDRLQAKAVIPGGQSFNPSSKHFNDQSERFVTGNLRDVFFYRDDVEKHKEKAYKPGD